MKRNFNSWTRRFFACVVCGVFAVSVVWAERVSQEDAALVANNFMNVTSSSAHGQKAPAKRMVMKATAAAEENQFYIYENADGEGWVMVAANDVVRPILAYSNEGYFRTDNMPRNVKGWLGKYNKQIKLAEENGVVASEDVQQEWKKLRKGVSIKKATPVVAPLIQTKWDQDDPYWNLCPMKGSTHDCYTGCVATAMAQVMYYWKWPKQGIGSYSYTTQSLGLSCSADFANTTYDWDNMLLKYNGYYPEGSSTWTTSGVPTATTAQKNAIATLMYHCGVAVAMDYNIASAGGSGAYTIRPNASQATAKCAQNALVQNFGYKSTIKGYYRPGGYGYSAVSDANWHNYLKTELDAARPIMYAGADDEGGHSFICDGYDNTTPTRKYHFNWGWSGYCDGYYDIDNLAPGIGGAGSGNGSYNDAQDIIIGIEPNITGHSVVKNATGCSISSASVAENNKAFTATITPTDATYDFTSLTVKLGSTTLKENTHYTLSSDKKELTILASAITGDNSNDLTITAVWTKNRYNYALLGEYCTPEETDGMLEKNAALNLTIQPTSGYTLAYPACWDVEMGGNKLTYGTGFTYNASNGAFAISKVTGDVNILVYGGKQVTWMANGSSFATTLTSSDKYVLPTTSPSIDCEGREFYGWCAEEYSHETTAPSIVKDGDAATQGNIFYAVFAKKGEGGGEATVTKASSIAVGDRVILVYEEGSKELSGIGGGNTKYGEGADYTNTPEGVYLLEVVAGSESGTFALKHEDDYLQWTSGNSLNTKTSIDENSSWTITFSSGNAIINNAKDATRSLQWNSGNPRFACYTSAQKAVQLYKAASGGASYSDYTTSCTPPCEGELTGITLNTENVKKVFTEGEAFNYDGLVVTALYDGCDNKTVKPTSVSSPNMNQTGEQTITVTYEGKSAEYTINVTALPTYAIRFYNNGVQVGATQNVKQGQAAAKPATDPEACEGYTFVGWYTEALAEDNTKAPTYVTNFTATKDQDYLAVYSQIEEGESSSAPSNNYELYNGALVEGDYIIVYDDVAMNTTVSNDRLQMEDVTITNNVITTTDATIIWHIAPSGNYWTIYNVGESAYAAGTGVKNKAQLLASGTDDKSLWTCSSSASSETYDFVNKANTASGVNATLRRNGTYGFACYATTTGGALSLYKNAAGSGPSSTTYYTTAPDCATPVECELTGITLNTDNVKKVFTEGATFSYEGLVVTANYSNCDSKAVTPTSVSSPDMSTVGEKAVVVTYEGKNAEYKINVTALPTYAIRFFNNGAQVGETQNVKQGQAATKPATDPEACEGYTFVGWYTEALAENNTDKPSYVTDFTATQDQDYLAVFSKTEEGEGGGEGAFDGETAGTYKIYAIVNETKYFAKGTASKLESTTNEVEATEYTFEVVEGGFAIKADGLYLKYGTSGTDLSTTSDAYTWTIGTGVLGTWRINATTGSNRAIIFRANGTDKFGAYATSNVKADGNEYYDLEIGAEGGSSSTTYYTTAPNCAPPVICELTGITLNTTNVKKIFTEGETFNYEGLVVTANYSNCDSKIVKPTSVSEPDMNQTGKQTITVTYGEKEASYEITVNALPIYTIQFFNNGTLYSKQDVKQGQKAEKPDPDPTVCDGYTFVGWSAVTVEETTAKPALENDFIVSDDQNYYAVYSKTEEAGEGAFDGETAGIYKIYAIVNETKYFAKGTASKLESTTNEAEATEYTFEAVEGGFAIKADGLYLKYGTSGTDLSTTSDAYTWTIGTGVLGTWRINATTGSNRAIIFRANGTDKFGAYATSNVKADGNEYYDLEIGAEGGSRTFYFSTVSCSETPTELVNMGDNNSAVQKILRNGQLLIIRDGKTYNIMGNSIQ